MKKVLITFGLMLFLTNFAYSNETKCADFKKFSKEYLKCNADKIKKLLPNSEEIAKLDPWQKEILEREIKKIEILKEETRNHFNKNLSIEEVKKYSIQLKNIEQDLELKTLRWFELSEN